LQTFYGFLSIYVVEYPIYFSLLNLWIIGEVEIPPLFAYDTNSFGLVLVPEEILPQLYSP